ncbi:ribonuclease P protein component, partial [Porphyromonas gingivalis]|uniref:ribonuclease P protein component n=1 Tax=Porphyromonas gingivalis TaxID=837 RepID=UPI0027BB052C
VKRNRVKRLVREAYRLNKHLLNDVLQERQIYATIAFMVVSDECRRSKKYSEIWFHSVVDSELE